MTDKLLVAAIDFGTTFSGYAFSFSHDFKHDPLKISANQWIGGGHISLKTSTTVLFGPDKTFHSFGYEAEDKYTQLAENEEHHDWYFFRRFKMKLHQDKEGHKMTDKLLVAAIDFGTTFSGYAFSFSHDFKHDPLKISANQWIGGGHISLKTSTTVLFGPDKTFHSFGYEAEDKYTQLAENEEHHDWYFFRRFKMKLHQDKGVSRGMLLTDEHRKTMPALQVFTASIRYLKDHLLTNIHKRVSSIADDDIQWVLTVPAIWSESAKQFMREAAEDAGIDGDKLLLALEPEAASIYCKELPVDKFAVGGPACKSALRPGSKYIVMDIGGGTADFTVHQVTDRGVLREISAASGGPWGGTKVDDAFYNFLASVFGEEILADFCREYTADYLDIMREFEVKKRTVNPSTDGKTTMRIPVSLFDLFRKRKGKTFAQAHEGTPVADKMSARRDKMQFRADVFKSFFKDCIQGIIDHVKDIFFRRFTRN